MLKRLTLLLFIFFIANVSFAQSLIIEGASPRLYLNHKVLPKENFYSVSRKYNVPPKDIAAYNNLQFEKGLNVGEIIKIPLTENNFVQGDEAPKSEAFVPVYHAVLPKEGLYRISVNYNKVSLATIKKWNHLPSDNVSIGTPLIVGYLKVDKTASSLVNDRLAKPGAQIVQVTGNDANVQPSENKPSSSAETEKKESITPANTNENKVADNNALQKTGINFSGGYFKNLYETLTGKRSPINETAEGSTFKSTSGWQDGKYYCFSNDAPQGSIVKITNSANNKSIYAKVLDAVPDIKQNNGIKIIISNAAADELGVADKFDCSLGYVK